MMKCKVFPPKLREGGFQLTGAIGVTKVDFILVEVCSEVNCVPTRTKFGGYFELVRIQSIWKAEHGGVTNCMIIVGPMRIALTECGQEFACHFWGRIG